MLFEAAEMNSSIMMVITFVVSVILCAALTMYWEKGEENKKNKKYSFGYQENIVIIIGSPGYGKTFAATTLTAKKRSRDHFPEAFDDYSH